MTRGDGVVGVRHAGWIGAVASILVLVAACGGSGGSNGGNRPPEARLGPDQAATVGDTVTLDASGSTDPDGDGLTFAWDLTDAPAASTASLSAAGGTTTELTPDVAGGYTVRVRVSDGDAEDRATTEITASQDDSDPNQPPNADAGTDRDVTVGESVTLDATGSSDPDGDDLNFAWSFVTAPGDAPDLNGGDTPTPTFTPEDSGAYTLQVTVSDGEETASDRVTVSADPGTPSNTVYVSPEGDDGDPGTREAPVATVERALEVADTQDVGQVFLFDGRYDSEPYDYTVRRSLFVEGESRDGVVLDAGRSDVLSLERPNDAEGTLKLFLQDLTLETSGRGLHLPDGDTAGYLTRVRCDGAAPCASTGDAAGFLPVPGGTLVVRDSLAVGDGSGNGFSMIGREHRIDSTTVRAYGAGVRAMAAGFTLANVTLENNDVGVHAWLAPDDDTPVAVRSGSRLVGNGTGVLVEDAAVRVRDATIRDSSEHGVLLDGSDDSQVVLIDATVEQNGFSGARAHEGQLEVSGGRYAENGQANPAQFTDRAGIFAGGPSDLIVDGATVRDNGQDNLVVTGAAAATFRNVTSRGAPDPGAGAYVSTSADVQVEGGTYAENHNGFYVTDGDLTLEGVTVRDNANNGLAYAADGGELRVRGSDFRANLADNVQIRDEPAMLDFGTPGDPGNNVLERAQGTAWSLSDERPDRSDPDGVLLQAADMTFGEVGSWSGRHTGPLTSTVGGYWRITGTNQRIDFH
ncbi:MAG: PKD domain-containing protein [Trueperaceae bacterium]|nr:PKD domain-containing protein [Trueperaceae bacterium]